MNFKFKIQNSKLTNAARRAWWWLRQITGDAAYENYLQSAASPRGRRANLAPGGAAGQIRASTPADAPVRPTEQVMTREEFYLDALRRRYAGVSRCC